ncbi:MAG: cytochrome C, partial [Acidimicrobiia bacterium]
MKASKAIRRTGALVLAFSMLLTLGVSVSAQESEGMDHSAFGPLEGPFETGPDVTAACLTCHAGVGEDFMETVHWTWEYESATTGETYGKYQVLNNYCVNVRTN